jgi:hypothetical protein
VKGRTRPPGPRLKAAGVEIQSQAGRLPTRPPGSGGSNPGWQGLVVGVRPSNPPLSLEAVVAGGGRGRTATASRTGRQLRRSWRKASRTTAAHSTCSTDPWRWKMAACAQQPSPPQGRPPENRFGMAFLFRVITAYASAESGGTLLADCDSPPTATRPRNGPTRAPAKSLASIGWPK